MLSDRRTLISAAPASNILTDSAGAGFLRKCAQVPRPDSKFLPPRSFAELFNLRLAFSVYGPCKENTAAVTATTLPEIPGLRSRWRCSRGCRPQDRGGALERRQRRRPGLDRHVTGCGIVRRRLL